MIENLKSENCGEIVFDANLSKYNTYKVNSIVAAIVFPNNIEQLKNIINFCNKNNIKYKLIGNGSNLVFSKKSYDLILINLKNFKNFEVDGTTLIAECGVNLMKLAYHVSKLGLSGLEFATGIPATVGGAVFMNAGAYNSSISDVLESIKVLDDKLNIIEIKNEDLDFSYRHSLLQDKKYLICLEAKFKLKNKNTESILNLIEDRKKRRINSQPLEFPSAGSVFRNPSDTIYAGKLIEDLGLKGFSIGGAMVSKKHANFIINYNNASGEDIKKLILYVKQKVKEKYGIDLKVEQEFIES